MTIDLSNRHFIDGIDLWIAFGVFVESGSDDFLKWPGAKQGISHDWQDSNGVDVDLSRRFLDQRTVQLKCAIIADSEIDFWLKHQRFIAALVQPGKRRFEIAQFTGKSFYVYYKETGNFSRFTRIKGADKVACKFSITIVENEPQIDNDNVFIVDDAGRFLIT
jgi:hypothetical protein